MAQATNTASRGAPTRSFSAIPSKNRYRGRTSLFAIGTARYTYVRMAGSLTAARAPSGDPTKRSRAAQPLPASPERSRT